MHSHNIDEISIIGVVSYDAISSRLLGGDMVHQYHQCCELWCCHQQGVVWWYGASLTLVLWAMVPAAAGCWVVIWCTSIISVVSYSAASSWVLVGDMVHQYHQCWKLWCRQQQGVGWWYGPSVSSVLWAMVPPAVRCWVLIWCINIISVLSYGAASSRVLGGDMVHH